jgi:imidazolonepropionase-like amidohydrolase
VTASHRPWAVVGAHVHTVGPAGVIRDGAVVVRGELLEAVLTRAELEATYPGVETLDLGDACLMPGLVDAHTHNLEFGPATAYGAEGAQRPGAARRLLTEARRAGVTSLGEHVLGLSAEEGLATYADWARPTGQTVRFAVGSCVIGTDPLARMSAAADAMTDRTAPAGPAELERLAALSQFPGENLFVTATVGNLPAERAPLAGMLVTPADDLARAVAAYHAAGQRIGAHTEGTAATLAFVRAGGDVVHHADGLCPEAYLELAAAGVTVCLTPAGGTGTAPASPAQVLALHDAGVAVVIATDAVLPFHQDSPWGGQGRLALSGSLLELVWPTVRAWAQEGRPVDEVLAMVTAEAAALLGIEAVTGSLEPGKRADLVAVAGLHGAAVAEVTTVVCGGELVRVAEED